MIDIEMARHLGTTNMGNWQPNEQANIRLGWNITPEKVQKHDWTVLNRHFLGFYPTDLDGIFSIFFASLFYIEILKPIIHLSG